MRGLLITPEGIKEVIIGDGDNEVKSIADAIGCDYFTDAGCPDDKHVCYADDEGLLKNTKMPITHVKWHPEPLVGNLLVLGMDWDSGDSTDCTLSINELSWMLVRRGWLIPKGADRG